MSGNILRIAFVLMLCSTAFGQTIEYHAVCVGDNYPGTNYELQWCVADARSVRDATKQYQSWLDGNIAEIEDAQATKSSIINNISAMPRSSTNIDLFHVSSHGSTSGLFTFDQQYISPSDLQGAFGSFNQYTAWLDACQTGVFTTSMTKGVILAACRSDEYASEWPALGHGTFSYFLIQGLTNNTAAASNGLLSAEGLYNYAAPRTTAYDSGMHPQLKDNYSGDLILNRNIYVPQQYSALSSALAASHNGQTVVVSSGNQTVTSSVTVPSGVVLSVKPAVRLSFGSGASLISNGTLQGSKVVPGVRDGSRYAYLVMHQGIAVAEAIIKRGDNTKLCSLRIKPAYQHKAIGPILFAQIAYLLEEDASNVHFTAPEGLVEERKGLFNALGFQNVGKAGRQYRLGQDELVFRADSRVFRHRAIRWLAESQEKGTETEEDQRPLVLSVQPKHAFEIASNRKTIEVRRRFSGKHVGRTVFLYATKPSGSIVAEARVAAVLEGAPTEIWNLYEKQIRCTKLEYIQYCSGLKRVKAIFLEEVFPYPDPLPWQVFSAAFSAPISPPQSYAILEPSGFMLSRIFKSSTPILAATRDGEQISLF